MLCGLVVKCADSKWKNSKMFKKGTFFSRKVTCVNVYLQQRFYSDIQSHVLLSVFFCANAKHTYTSTHVHTHTNILPTNTSQKTQNYNDFSTLYFMSKIKNSACCMTTVHPDVGLAEMAACLCVHPQLISSSCLILSCLLFIGVCHLISLFHSSQTSKDWYHYAAGFMRLNYK